MMTRVEAPVGLLKFKKRKRREEEEKKTSCYNVGLFKATPLLDCVSFNYFTLKFLPVKYLKMGNAFINLA